MSVGFSCGKGGSNENRKNFCGYNGCYYCGYLHAAKSGSGARKIHNVYRPERQDRQPFCPAGMDFKRVSAQCKHDGARREHLHSFKHDNRRWDRQPDHDDDRPGRKHSYTECSTRG